MATKSLQALLHEKRLAGAKRRSVSKAKDKAKAARATGIDQIRKDIIGYTIEWFDTDPLGDGKEDESSLNIYSENSNPFIRSIAGNQWDDMDMRTWIVTSVFTWIATVTVVFKLPNNKSYSLRRDEWEFRITDHLRDPAKGDDTKLNKEIINKITASLLGNMFYKDSDKNKGSFLRAEYKIVCVGV